MYFCIIYSSFREDQENLGFGVHPVFQDYPVYQDVKDNLDYPVVMAAMELM